MDSEERSTSFAVTLKSHESREVIKALDAVVDANPATATGDMAWKIARKIEMLLYRDSSGALQGELLVSKPKLVIHEVPREHRGPQEQTVARALMHGARLDQGELKGGVRFNAITDEGTSRRYFPTPPTPSATFVSSTFVVETDLGSFRVTVEKIPAKRVYADFNAKTEDGLVRLNTPGSLKSMLGEDLKVGELVVLTDEEIMFEAVLESSTSEPKIWLGRLGRRLK